MTMCCSTLTASLIKYQSAINCGRCVFWERISYQVSRVSKRLSSSVGIYTRSPPTRSVQRPSRVARRARGGDSLWLLPLSHPALRVGAPAPVGRQRPALAVDCHSDGGSGAR